MKPIIQAEAAECGLASMAMVAQYHGHKIDLNSMRQRFGLSLKGAGLRDLMNMADELGFSTRPLRLEPQRLKDIALPAIIHWDLNHFVVLKMVKGNGNFVVFDPARGRVEYGLPGISKHFTGVALEIIPTASFRPMEAKAKTKLTSLWTKANGFKRSFIQLLMLSSVVQFFVLVSPFFMQLTIDEAVTRFDRDLLLLLALGFGFLYITNTVTSALRSWVILQLGQFMTFQIAGNVLRHLVRLPVDFFEKHHVGDIISRMGSIQPIQTALTQSVVAALIDGIMAVTTAVMILVYSWKLALIAIVFTVSYLIISLVLFPFLRARQEDLIAKGAKEQSHVMETVRASRAIKQLSRENERESAWRNLYAEVVDSGLAYGKLSIGGQFAGDMLSSIQTVLLVYFGATFILNGEMTIGMLFAFMSYQQNFTSRAEGLVDKSIEFRMLGLHLERLADIIQTDKEKGIEVPASKIREIKGQIEVDKASFRYSHNDPLIFENLSLLVRPGEYVAISGTSGGGKTTLLKVMLGHLQPISGDVRVDGLPLQTLGLRNWRSAIGVVMQDDSLLSGTIADNISCFDPQIDMNRVIKCAQLAQIHDEISQMPMQYLSLIGDMGAAISGGQRQRLLLARALYNKPRVLFLDEGTANIDEQTEKQIADVVSQMEITRVVIAHRPELLRRADRIFDMVEGNLIERK